MNERVSHARMLDRVTSLSGTPRSEELPPVALQVEDAIRNTTAAREYYMRQYNSNIRNTAPVEPLPPALDHFVCGVLSTLASERVNTRSLAESMTDITDPEHITVVDTSPEGLIQHTVTQVVDGEIQEFTVRKPARYAAENLRRFVAHEIPGITKPIFDTSVFSGKRSLVPATEFDRQNGSTKPPREAVSTDISQPEIQEPVTLYGPRISAINEES